MKSIVTHIGEMAFEFEEDKVLVFFGPKAPSELRDVSIIHEGDFTQAQSLVVGHSLTIQDISYEIVSVGTQALHNLQELGHISVYFTHPPTDILPGSIYVKPHVMPSVTVGSSIKINE